MKRLSKIFILVLTLALLTGAIFAIASSAEETEAPKYWYDGSAGAMTGATRRHRDFTAEKFDAHYLLEAGINATPHHPDFYSDKIVHPNDICFKFYGDYVLKTVK